MKKLHFTTVLSFLFFLLTALMVRPALTLAIPVDLTETTGGFVISDPLYVFFGAAVNEASLFEDVDFGLTYLSNDPYLGDPGILVPGDATTLTFDLEFSTTGSDNFEVLVLDPTGGTPFFDLFHDGTIFGPGTYIYENVSVDLVALNLLGASVGLEFDLTSNIGDTTFDSILSISNANINQSINPVPEPATFLLLSVGLIGFAVTRKKLGFRKQWNVKSC